MNRAAIHLSVFIWSFLCCLIHGHIDVLDLQQDNQTMHRGANLMYLSLGSKEHNLKVAQSIISSFNVQSWGCYDAHEHLLISNHVHDSHQNEDIKLVVVHGLECLSSSERRALDFAYRLTDSSSDVSNVIVLFSMKIPGVSSTFSAVTTDSALEMKLKVAEALNEDSVFFNGHAFTGRLTRTFFESSNVEIELPAPGCVALVLQQDDMCTQLNRAMSKHNQESRSVAPYPLETNSNSVWLVIGALMVIVLMVVLLVIFKRSGADHGESSSKTVDASQRSVSATVYSSSSTNYTKSYIYSDTQYTSTANTHTSSYYPESTSTPYDTSYDTTNTPSEVSPKRREGAMRRSLTRMQAKQLGAAASANTDTTDYTATTAATTRTHTISSKDRRSTGSIANRTKSSAHHAHTSHTSHTNSSPAGEEAIMWAGPDSNVHDTRSKKHTRSSARF